MIDKLQLFVTTIIMVIGIMMLVGVWTLHNYLPCDCKCKKNAIGYSKLSPGKGVNQNGDTVAIEIVNIREISNWVKK